MNTFAEQFAKCKSHLFIEASTTSLPPEFLSQLEQKLQDHRHFKATLCIADPEHISFHNLYPNAYEEGKQLSQTFAELWTLRDRFRDRLTVHRAHIPLRNSIYRMDEDEWVIAHSAHGRCASSAANCCHSESWLNKSVLVEKVVEAVSSRRKDNDLLGREAIAAMATATATRAPAPAFQSRGRNHLIRTTEDHIPSATLLEAYRTQQAQEKLAMFRDVIVAFDGEVVAAAANVQALYHRLKEREGQVLLLIPGNDTYWAHIDSGKLYHHHSSLAAVASEVLDGGARKFAPAASPESSDIVRTVDELLKDLRRILWRCKRRLRNVDYALAVQLLNFLSSTIQLETADVTVAELDLSSIKHLENADIAARMQIWVDLLDGVEESQRRTIGEQYLEYRTINAARVQRRDGDGALIRAGYVVPELEEDIRLALTTNGRTPDHAIFVPADSTRVHVLCAELTSDVVRQRFRDYFACQPNVLELLECYDEMPKVRLEQGCHAQWPGSPRHDWDICGSV